VDYSLYRVAYKGPPGIFLKDQKRRIMDLLLVTKDNIWDIEVHNGSPRVISDDNEKVQRAMIASFIQKDTLPLMPNTGLDWSKYLTGEMSLSEIDAKARANINLYMESLMYVPYYKVVNGQLIYNITKVEINGAGDTL